MGLHQGELNSEMNAAPYPSLPLARDEAHFSAMSPLKLRMKGTTSLTVLPHLHWPAGGKYAHSRPNCNDYLGSPGFHTYTHSQPCLSFFFMFSSSLLLYKLIEYLKYSVKISTDQSIIPCIILSTTPGGKRHYVHFIHVVNSLSEVQ